MIPGGTFEDQLLEREKQGLLHGQVDGRNITAAERRERYLNPVGPYIGSSPDGKHYKLTNSKRAMVVRQ